MRTKSKSATKRASDNKYIGQESSAEPKAQSIPEFARDVNGRIAYIKTKKYVWLHIRLIESVDYLQNVLKSIEQANKKFNEPWYAIDQELKRRQSSGEIKPKSHEVSVD